MDVEINIKSIISILYRQHVLIIITIATIIFLTMLVVYSITPKYTANAIILVDTSYKDLLDSDIKSQNTSADNARVESEVGILKSDHILLDVIRENSLVSDSEFGIKTRLTDRVFSWLRLPLSKPPTNDEAIGEVLNTLRPALSINRNGLTYLINIGVVSLDPVKSAKLANAVSESYIKEQISSKVSSTLRARDTIQNRVIAANATIVENEKSFDTYITQNIDRLEKASSSVDLTSLHSQLEQLNQQRVQQDLRVEALRKSIIDQDFLTISTTLGSEAVKELEKQREELTKRLTTTNNEQIAVNLRTELEKLNTDIKLHATQQLDSLRKTVAVYQNQSNEVRGQLRSAVLQSNLPPEVLTDIYGLQQSAEIARSQYQNLLSKLQKLDSQSHLQLPDSRVVSAALPPNAPSYPNKLLIFSIALVVALGLSIILSIFREYYIGGFISEDQVEAVLKLPLAAIAPYQSVADQSAQTISTGSTADLMISNPLSQFSESIRRIRLALDHGERRKLKMKINSNGGKVIMVSSSLPNEGKSTIALSLARAYALTGKRTLLIDCDLRKPSIYKYLNLNASSDFADFLRQEDSTSGLNSIALKDPLSKLIVLLGSRRSDIVTDELFMGEKMAHILSSARKHFDYIILDTPPIEPIVDALYLSRLADMIVFVIRWASTSQTSAKRSITALNEFKNSEAGIITVLNQKKKPQISGYFDNNYGYYSK